MQFVGSEMYEEDAAIALDGSAFYLHADRLARVPRAHARASRTQALTDDFRQTMRTLAGGVVLITTYVGGRPWGVTVTSCTSLSVVPARIVVSLMRSTATCQAIEAGTVFGVNILGDAHKRLAQFGAARGAPKFLDADHGLGVSTTSGTLAPMVDGALSHLDCELDHVFDGGDHALLVGRVLGVVTAHPHSSASPLLYFDGGFHHLGSPL